MEEFDAIVVGAGPAGCAAAYVMAKAGHNVLVLERGKFPGAKNMWGGAFFGPVMNELFPGFWEEAPFERFVTRHAISFLTEQDILSIDYKSDVTEPAEKKGFITLRAKFDKWMSQKVEQAGAIVASGLAVDDLIVEGGVVKGVKVGDEQFASNAVVLADGVNSLLSEKIGLRKAYSPHDMKQGVKEIIRLPREVIEDRFNISGTAGVAMEFIGSCTRGLPGGGFMYTNLDSVSLGVVVQLSALMDTQIKASDLIEDFKNHPAIAQLIKGGQTAEYSAHLIPVSGLKMMPKLYDNGVLVTGDAASLVLGTGLILEGANFAVASGMAAAETVIEAHRKEDFTRDELSNYEKRLREQFVLKDLQTFSRAPQFLENERIYQLYPELACSMARKIFSSDGKPRENTFKVLRKSLGKQASMWKMASDMIKAGRAL
ncbi:MAG: FAD-binding protein [Deltaproteobacteria bacterium]|nr:FAD-binding protein [Deltaproteobacteria bacterium]